MDWYAEPYEATITALYGRLYLVIAMVFYGGPYQATIMALYGGS
jgi:hypothetical protein